MSEYIPVSDETLEDMNNALMESFDTFVNDNFTGVEIVSSTIKTSQDETDPTLHRTEHVVLWRGEANQVEGDSDSEDDDAVVVGEDE